MMQEWADKLGKGGSRIRVELIALSKPRGLNSFLNVRFVPGADELTELLFKGTVLSKNIDMPIQYEQTILATRGKKSNVATAKILEYNG